MRIIVTVASLLAFGAPAWAAKDLTVAPVTIADEKAVFATVESLNVVPARARIGGTLAELTVKEGDHVDQGQTIATVGDEKLVLQLKSLDAQIAGLKAQLAQAQTDYDRIKTLVDHGTLPRTRLDEAETALRVAQNALESRIAERSVIEQQLSEGAVLSPAAGRILKVPVTIGAVLLPGESIATVAKGDFVLRLRVPERHARFLKAGDGIRIDASEFGGDAPRFGKITLVYPQIEDGRVVADAVVAGLGDYFVSERLRVWIAGGERQAFVIPQSFMTTRFGIDYVKLRQKDEVTDVPVQRGRDLPRPDMPDGVEILSGVAAGDELVQP